MHKCQALTSVAAAAALHASQAANKEGETPLALAGELAAALQAARASGSVSNGTNGAMEH